MFYTPIRRLTSPRELSLAVVGLDYPNPDKSHRRFEMALCCRAEPVRLIREPTNKYDKRAVAVFSNRGIQLGYLTAERCGLIGGWLDDGEAYSAVFQESGRTAAIIRVRFGAGALSLPPDRNDLVRDWSEEGGDAFDWGC
ncbi:HIRAN domain-containing protein [Sphingomonas melonis]|nr:HIRAN domain-containing protein [Sphingomonas melonis]